MPNRRTFDRIPASQVPWLSASTGRCPELRLLDISDGGALIESDVRWTPGERGVFILQGSSAVKVAGRIVRAEIARLAPSLSYRTAVRFGAPVNISSLGTGRVELEAPRELHREFTRVMGGLPSVHAVRVAGSLRTVRGTESVHFAVPESIYGDRRVLQVFFHQQTYPTVEEFRRLRDLAALASGLPDIDLARPDNSTG